MSNQTPTLIFVHGAGHDPSCWELLIPHLTAVGYDSIAYVALPSVGSTPEEATFEKDVKAVSDVVESSLNETGRDCVLVVHSYGGVVGSEGAKGFAKKDRDGKPGIVKIVYVAAIVPAKGSDTMTFTGSEAERQAEMKRNEGKVILKDGSWEALDAVDRFYNDVPKDVAEAFVAKLRTQPIAPFFGKITYEAWKEIPSWYYLCLKDNALPPSMQERIVKHQIMEYVERVESGHSPFASQPEKLANFIRRAIGEKL